MVVSLFHTASPFIHGAKEPVKDLIKPAVHGTENVLLVVVDQRYRRVPHHFAAVEVVVA
jgi:hypothetical protein